MSYRARTGVTTAILLIKQLCRLYTTYSSKINAWVSASSLTAGEKASILSWLAAAQATCALMELIPDD